MIKIYLCWVFSFLLLLVDKAYAVKETNNGGHSIVCRNPDGSIRSAQLLDYFEASRRAIDDPRWTIKMGAGDLSVDAKLALALDRLERWSPHRAQRYREQISEFVKEAAFTDETLPMINDSDYDEYPAGCRIEQLAIQNSSGLPGVKRYKINRQIFNMLSNDDRAGLFLHEVIYREALSYDHQRSVKTRYFNAMLASDQLRYYSGYEAIRGFLRALNFAVMDYQGVDIKISECAPHTGGVFKIAMPPKGYCQTAVGWEDALPSDIDVQDGIVRHGSAVILQKGTFLGGRKVDFDWDFGSGPLVFYAAFFDSGHLQRLTLPSDDEITLTTETRFGPLRFVMNGGEDRVLTFADIADNPISCGRVKGPAELEAGGAIRIMDEHVRLAPDGRAMEILKNKSVDGWWCSSGNKGEG